jgi:hypothetical protein
MWSWPRTVAGTAWPTTRRRRCSPSNWHQERIAQRRHAVPDAVLLCAAYLLDRRRVHPMLAELPKVVHLPARCHRVVIS